ncbi:MAG: hypothetical protein ACQKBT_09280 [Puniceicoccales bacterium]
MYGYIFAIVGTLVLIVVIGAVLATGSFRNSKSNREDFNRGTSYAEPQSEGTTTAEVETPNRSTPSRQNPHKQ